MLARMLTHFVNGNDVRMLQVRGGLSLTVETFNLIRTCQRPSPDHFQCDYAFKTGLARLPNDSHASLCDLFQQLVIAKVSKSSPSLGRGGLCRWQILGVSRLNDCLIKVRNGLGLTRRL